MSNLRQNARGFILRNGKRFRLVHGVATSTIVARMWQTTTSARILAASGNVYVTAHNTYEFLTQVENDSAAGDIVTPYVAGAVGSVEYFLFVAFKHSVGEVDSHKKFYAMRINQTSLTVQRYTNVAGPVGGVTTAKTNVATGVKAHFWEADETVRIAEGMRTEQFAGVMVTKKGLGIAAGHVVTINSKLYEITGFDVDALEGLVVNRLERVK